MLAKASGSGNAAWLARPVRPPGPMLCPAQAAQAAPPQPLAAGPALADAFGKSAWQRPRPPRRRRQRRALAGGFGPRLWVGALGSVRVDIDSIPPGIAHNNNFNFDIGRSSIHGLNKNSLPGAN